MMPEETDILDPKESVNGQIETNGTEEEVENGNAETGENEAEEMYGAERLLDLVAGIDSATNAEGVIEAILKDVAHFVGDAEQYDDITVVALQKI